LDQELIDSIQKLIEEGKGDSGRLNHIIDSLKMGKILYKSDARYLDQLISKDSKKEVLHKNFEPEKEIKTETPKIISNYKSAGVTVIISMILGAIPRNWSFLLTKKWQGNRLFGFRIFFVNSFYSNTFTNLWNN